MDEGAPGGAVEAAIGVCYERPDQAEDSRQACERAIGELGQLAIVAWRKIKPDFSDLTFDKMEVVDEPFRRGGDGRLVLDGRTNRSIGPNEACFIGCQAVEQRMTQLPVRLDNLGKRQAARVLLHTLDAEERFANGGCIVPW